MTTMKAAILNKPLDIEVKEIAVPKPKEDEVLIKVHCIGVCGSDVHYYEHGKIGRYVVEKPIILGHELAGDIVEVGSKVKNLEAGDRVAVEPGVTCGTCEYCKTGRYNLCPEVQFMATPPVDGAWAEYVTIRSDFAFKIPDQMSYEEGALIEPLSVGIHGMQRGKVHPNDKMLITGLGPIGLLAIKAAKIFGVTEIYCSDVVPFRRELAMKLGATKVFDPTQDNIREEVDQLTTGSGIDIAVETSGNGRAVQDVLTITKRGGRIVLVGLPAVSEVPIDITHIVDSEYDIYGMFRYANSYPTAIQAIGNNDLQLEDVITHKYSLNDIKEAVEMARTQKDTSIKIMIYPGK
ncbi:NAD(P)-dependent alcohol dehydrogenase [Gracilibacillus alcaliphilus]|uniref:NAD(P)-dependent alcohol dehydrogenase n=1 Tax=Gracilibacillus alcaliphilus TaxID=1401441 RepID=UPI00195B41BD|nr:NAD(P)-dependent alcohol dehydrogenase [Gracilibacillus alcaliphilus]MBM7676222.1 L-iditol 2-dehydrogenase [Gracilibacillus alcaliphilus]